MAFIKKTGVVFIFFWVSNICFSQEDSLTKMVNAGQKVLTYATDKFAIARPLNIEYSQNSPYNYSSKLDGTDLPEGKVENFYQLKASANVNFIKKQKWMLGTTLNYRYISIDINSLDWLSGVIQNQKQDFHYHFTSLNFTYFSKLFNKTIIYSGSINVDGSQHHFERIRGLATATMVLKATPKTKMTLGLIAIVDPNIPVPAFFSFTYEHKFNNGWVADIILPKGVFMRKNIFNDGRISIGSELDNASFYLYDLGNRNKTYSFSQMEINSGIVYEHYLGGSFIATFKAGLKAFPMSRIADKKESVNNYIFKATPDPSFYFNIGVSFNPFTLLGEKR